jgi:hypothetical protein
MRFNVQSDSGGDAGAYPTRYFIFILSEMVYCGDFYPAVEVRWFWQGDFGSG